MDDREVVLIERIVGYIKDHIVYENDDRLEDVLADLEEVIFALDTYGCSKVIDEIKYQIKTLCDKDDKCPSCFSDLSVVYDKEVHSHLDDKPVELLLVHTCEECGWNNRMD